MEKRGWYLEAPKFNLEQSGVDEHHVLKNLIIRLKRFWPDSSRCTVYSRDTALFLIHSHV